jgi:hypothetical protein
LRLNFFFFFFKYLFLFYSFYFIHSKINIKFPLFFKFKTFCNIFRLLNIELTFFDKITDINKFKFFIIRKKKFFLFLKKEVDILNFEKKKLNNLQLYIKAFFLRKKRIKYNKKVLSQLFVKI